MTIYDMMADDLAATAFDAADEATPCEAIAYSAPGVGDLTFDALVLPVEIDDRPAADREDTDVRIRRIVILTADAAAPDRTKINQATVTLSDGSVWSLDRIEWSQPGAWAGVFARTYRRRLAAGRPTMEDV